MAGEIKRYSSICSDWQFVDLGRQTVVTNTKEIHNIAIGLK